MVRKPNRLPRYGVTAEDLALGLPGDLIPSIDNTYDVGSSTKGWKELHIATDFLITQGSDAVTLALRNSADTGYRKFDCQQYDIQGTTLFTKGTQHYTMGSGSAYPRLPIQTTVQWNAATKENGMLTYDATANEILAYINGATITLAGLEKAQIFSDAQTFQFMLLGVEVTNTNADTTPTVAGTSAMAITNSGATTISDFDDGAAGQVLCLRFMDANTTIDHDANGDGSGPIFLSSAGDKNFAANQCLLLVARGVGPVWFQIGGEI